MGSHVAAGREAEMSRRPRSGADRDGLGLGLLGKPSFTRGQCRDYNYQLLFAGPLERVSELGKSTQSLLVWRIPAD